MGFDYQGQPDDFWAEHLQPKVYQVCRRSKTERSGTGEYDKFYEKGTYYCACCGGDHAVFSSETKYDSGTGWPSFYAPILDGVITQPDPSDKLRGLFGSPRTEVICSRCLSHLGHLFSDGPDPTGERYCMNSLALVFVKAGESPKRTFTVADLQS